MNKKDDCEKAIRALCDKWAEGRPADPMHHESFYDFISWLERNGYSHYLHYRSGRGAVADAELWFNEERKQTWRD
jgi:hypothetical protein